MCTVCMYVCMYMYRTSTRVAQVNVTALKYIPVLLYAFDVCNLSKKDLMQSLDFTVDFIFYEIISNNDMSVFN